MEWEKENKSIGKNMLNNIDAHASVSLSLQYWVSLYVKKTNLILFDLKQRFEWFWLEIAMVIRFWLILDVCLKLILWKGLGYG